MIQFKAGDPGNELIGFGIDRMNVEKLKAGEPIVNDLTPMGYPGVKIMIIYGETVMHIQKQLAFAIGPNTKINPEPT